jgi:outer membrane protein
MKRFALSFWIVVIFCLVTLPGIAKGGGESGNTGDGVADIVEKARGTSGAANTDGSAGRGGPAGLSVEGAVDAAAESSVELVLEKLGLRQAAAEVKAVKAKRGPSLILQTTGSLMSNPMEGFKISEGAFGSIQIAPTVPPIVLPEDDIVVLEDAELTYFKITATLSQPLFTWGKLTGAATAAALNLDIAGEEYLVKEREVERGVRLAYFGTLFAERTAEILSRAVVIADEVVADRQSALTEGLITRQSVLTAASRKATLTAQLTRANEAAATARLTLSTLTGLEADQTILVSDFRELPLHTEETALLSAAFQASGGRAVLLHRIEQAATMLSVERGSRPFLPDVSLNLSVDVTGQKIPFADEDWTDSWDTNFIITLGTQTTLFDSGASSSRIEQAEAALEAAKQGLYGLELSLELQVRSLIEAVRIGWSDIQKATAELDLANEIERNAAVSFDNELITRAEALSAKLASLAVELERELALFTYETAVTELENLVSKQLVSSNLSN